jgi:parallel beta-helix repeat protein
MNQKGIAPFVIVAIFVVVAVVVGIGIYAATRGGGTIPLSYTNHDPIYINGNDNFTTANGITGGSGTRANPYIIESWSIDASSANGIDIRNTTAYFVIRNCLVENGGENRDGIKLENATNGRIENNILENDEFGIYMLNSSYDNVSGNVCNKDVYGGIDVESSPNNNLTSNVCDNSHDVGIYISNSDNNILTSNTCESNAYNTTTASGILVDNSPNNTLIGNICKKNYYGIILYSSSYVNLTNSTCDNNNFGICLSISSCDTLTNNSCDNNLCNFTVTMFTITPVPFDVSYYDHNIDNTNLVNGKPIYYFKDNSNLVIGSSLNVGCLFLVRCNNIVMENLVLMNNWSGISLISTENSLVENCTCPNNGSGIYLLSSNYDNIINNVCNSTTAEGIGVDWFCNNCVVSYNSCKYGLDGIVLDATTRSIVNNNNCSNNTGSGIFWYSSQVSSVYDNITNNLCENNGNAGLRLGWVTVPPCHETDSFNIWGNTFENNFYGISLDSSSNNNLTNNTCSNNSNTGICLASSSYNNLTSNTCGSNSYYGINLDYFSNNNTLTGNYLLNNTTPYADAGTNNHWS